uniref:Protein OS9-like domain-containing protein n=1 Tax=Kalanchoe fedtschenkoi TaxID=63787 RepID=A0A7N0V8J8_KALFE
MRWPGGACILDSIAYSCLTIRGLANSLSVELSSSSELAFLGFNLQLRFVTKMMKYPSLILFISFLLIQAQHRSVYADQIFGPRPGGGLGRGSREPKYRIEFHPEDSPFYPDDDQETVILPNKEGQKFLCYLPKVAKPKNVIPVAQHNSSSMIMETEKKINLKTPDELLDGLKDICLLRQEGWWTYEFCFKKTLRQLHLEDEKTVQEYVLGVFDAEATANRSDSDVPSHTDPQSSDAPHMFRFSLYL